MNAFIYHPLINVLLFITIIGEFAVPRILKCFYKEYNSKTMVMSVLGSPESPVRKIYNAWLILKETVFSYEGLWERMCLFFMYVPFLYDAIINLLSI